MASARFHFAGFTLDPADRRLSRDGQAIELNARYFDALALLVRQHGQLVTKDRFMDEVWSGVPVTDEALTQCIRSLRRALGDAAAAPRFIATVPKHGYRFVAPLDGEPPKSAQTPAASVAPKNWAREALVTAVAAALGGGAAGAVGGLLYGFAGLSQPLQSGSGAASLLTVLVSVCVAVGLLGGAAVGAGVAAMRRRMSAVVVSTMLGGALGGLAIGAVANMIGQDVFGLLFGRLPGAITGPGEGALLGGAVGLAAGWASRCGLSFGRTSAVAAAAGGVAGIAVALAGGRLMAGSLVEVARRFPDSRLRFEALGGLFGEDGFGPLAQIATAAGEGALFAAGAVGAMAWTERVRQQA